MPARRRPFLPRLARRLGLPAALMCVALGLGVVAAPASADSIDNRIKQAQKEQKANARKKAAADDALEGVKASLQKLSDQLLDTQAKIPAAQRALDAAQASYDSAQRAAALVTARLQDAQDENKALTTTIASDGKKATAMRAAIGEMAREAYRGGPEVSTVGVLLGADSTSDFIERYGLMTTAMRTQSQVLDQLREAKATDQNSQVRLGAVQDRIGELKVEAEQKVKVADAARDKAQQAKAALDSLLATQKTQQNALQAQKAALKQELAQIDAAAKKVSNDLKKALAEQRARDAKKHHSSGPPRPIVGAMFGNPTSTNPIYVTSPYGWRFHPILHYYRLHAGIDLRAHCGTPIYAGRSGTVLWAEYRYGFGSQVMVNHGIVNGNGLASSYNHLERMVVHSGQHVSQGQLVGYSGSEGLSTGCHLHFEVYVNGNTVNPAPLLGL
ncbi:peptidoglycan DD-metalloendopeptidase family protein [Cellulomonas alba]|uniref:Peptidoglycan DD-metalloendopeptidase family protein n=1 Tax=Cellulomonas alba TaxID=3053467 RepID=A0ABT7SKC9_9CELL|nr:peptidoglycan DD-metalloendopeptidase family protein [Cellulomonas alba]MDM7856647.1 peptidoglycan DD-metalloendopeptidase family protein [Cellulomonas alba]